MKTLSYNWAFIIKFIAISFLAVLPTGLTQNIINDSNFTYTERPIQSNLTGAQPRIIDINHYRDSQNTAIVRIARDNYIAGINRCFEQRLLLRVIQANGSVIPINFDNIAEIQDINYCIVNGAKNPISFYPLFDQYILVTYTHATDTSDNTTFMDKGVVIDWSGKNIRSVNITLDFGPSYLLPRTTIWNPSTFISINVTPKRGFLYLSAVNGTNDFEWKQYAYNGDGSFSLLQSDKNYNIAFNTFQVTVFATLNGGYAIVYANTTIPSTSSNSLAAQFTANAGIYAIILNYNQSYTSNPIILHEMSTPNFIVRFTTLYCSVDYVYIGHQLRFLSSGSVLKLDPVLNISSNTTPNIKILPLGGYAVVLRTFIGQAVNFTFNLYDEDNRQYNHAPIISNLFGAFIILNNNTMIIAQSETTTSWRLFSIDLPRLASYNALNTEEISITFHDRVSFSFSDANLTIYQRINQTNIVRQLINAKICNKCTASDKVITLGVFKCTFNDPSGHYFIQMDNNFVKSSEYGEPMLGIDSDMWTFQTDNGRLESNNHYQIDTSSIELKTLISLSIIAAKSSDKKNTNAIKDDLNLLIQNKKFTNLSTGASTNYLDETYGFQKAGKTIENFAIIQLGIAMFRIVTITAFTFTDAKGFNLILAFSILFMQRNNKFVEWFAKYGRVATSFALLSGSSIDVLLVLKSYLMKFELFNAPFSDKSLKWIFWGSCADVILADIPQFIIQIFYLLYSVEIEILLIFSLIASGLSVLSNLLSKLFFIKFKAYSPYLSTLYVHHAVESNDLDEIRDHKTTENNKDI
ncbi:33263_t:CDS:2 [Racocetra persica]|uniref:33263_t:CDS:1 n=1 Tax=Racocetra persica TaxID=160502 RepID=A0ACA9N140_9GLOM|nr:33263_t:CDS:2 [Racocetra persica]